MNREQALAAVGALTGLGGVTAAAACCVLPLALAGAGVTAAALAPVVPFHVPLSIVAVITIAGAWVLYLRRRRACAAGAECAPPGRSTLPLLVAASLLVALSGIWPLIEAPLTRMFE
ncbi:MAG TPA: hypothetical protein VFK58_08020 [Sphingomicrobium sp.]|nr:hypothetical protein [Sphingomicrobium sp.]